MFSINYHGRPTGAVAKVATKIMSILRNLFGPSRDVIWQQVAAAVGGTMTEGSFCGSIGRKVNAAPVDGHAGHLCRIVRRERSHLHPDAPALCQSGRFSVQPVC